MKNKQIKQQVDETFDVLNAIEKVEVNHFFKHKVLQQLNAEKQEKLPVFAWFTPSIQFASLCVILFLNVATVFYVFTTASNNNEKTSDIELFAQKYALQSESNLTLN
jgi:hypothetical protein